MSEMSLKSTFVIFTVPSRHKLTPTPFWEYQGVKALHYIELLIYTLHYSAYFCTTLI